MTREESGCEYKDFQYTSPWMMRMMTVAEGYDTRKSEPAKGVMPL